MASGDLRRYRTNWQNEVDSAALYRALAAAEQREELANVYLRLAEAEERHADLWQRKIEQAGETAPKRRVGWRARMLGWLAERFGPQFVLPTINEQERADVASYDAQSEAADTSLPSEERSHARLLQEISGHSPAGLEGDAIARLEGRRHRAASSGNALRAAVLGANDGLLSNFSLVMGVAGAAFSSQTILITGIAGLLAGAGSMAMGEWISVRSARELYGRQIELEREEVLEAPEEEQEELALIYRSKGLPEDQANALAARLMSDREKALDTLSREELGIDPDELGGSASGAALYSYLLFCLGAIVPVLPFLFLGGWPAVVGSALASGVGLFGMGAAITLFTGRSALFSGARQLLIGAAAAALTYGLGLLLGVSLGG